MSTASPPPNVRPNAPPPTRELLAEYAVLLNNFGVDSQEAESFLERNKANTEFVELAQLSKTLKAALTAPLGKHNSNCNK